VIHPGRKYRYNPDSLSFLLSTLLAVATDREEDTWIVMEGLVAKNLTDAHAIHKASEARKTLLNDIFRSAPHTQKVPSDWLCALCKALVERHNGLVPSTCEELEALPSVQSYIAKMVMQEGFGFLSGPAIDRCCVAVVVALDLIDIEGDKFSLDDLSKVTANQVEGSLKTWLHPQQWLDFNSLLVTTAQFIGDSESQEEIENVIKKYFPHWRVEGIRVMVEKIKQMLHTMFPTEDNEEDVHAEPNLVMTYVV